MRDRADVGDRGEQGDQRRAHPQADQGHRHRQPGRHHRTEREDQDQQRDEHADQFGHAAGRGEVLRHLAAERHLQPGLPGGGGRGPQGVHRLGAGEIGDRHVVPDGEQGGVPVGGQPGRVDRDDVPQVPQAAGQRVDGGRVEGTVGVVHDDPRVSGVGVAETLGEQVRPGLRG